MTDRLSAGWPVWRIAEAHGITTAEVRALIVESVGRGSAHGSIFGAADVVEPSSATVSGTAG